MYSKPLRHTAILLVLVAAIPAHALAETPSQYYALAANYYAQGNWAEATREFRELIANHPDSGKARESHFFLGEALVQQGKHQEALRAFTLYLERTGRHRHDKQASFRLGESSYLLGRTDQAIAALTSFVDEYPDDKLLAFALPYLGDCYLRSGEPQRAQETYQRALSEFPNEAYADQCRFGTGRALQALGQSEEAIRFYRFLTLRQDSSLADLAHFQIGTLCFQAGDYAEAAEEFEHFEGRESEGQVVAEGLFWLGKSRLQLDEPDKALLSFSNALLNSSDAELLPAIRFEKAMVLLDLKRGEEAEVILRQIWKESPESKWADDSLQIAISEAHHSGQFEQVLELAEEFESSFATSPLGWNVVETKGRTLYSLQQYTEAVEEFRKLLQHDPVQAEGSAQPSTNWNYLLGLCFIGDGKFAEAITALEQADVDSTASTWNAGVKMALAVAYYEKGDYPNAIRLQRNYLATNPDGQDACRCRADLAMSYAKMEQFEESATAFAELSEFNPDYPSLDQINHTLAELAYDHGEFAVSEKLFALLTEQAASDELIAAGCSGTAWSRTEMGRPEEATELFQRVINEFGATRFAAESALMCGKIFENRREFDAALAMYEIVWDRYPSTPQAPQALFSIAHLRQELGGAEDLLAAKARYQELLFRFPNSDMADSTLYQLAWVNLDLGNEDNAHRAFEKIAEEYPTSRYWGHACYRLAQQAMQGEELDEAARRLSQIIDNEHGANVHDYALYMQGQISAGQGDWTACRAAMSRIVGGYQQSPLLPSAKFWLAESAYRLGAFEEAAGIYEQLASEAREQPHDWSGIVTLRQAQLKGLNEQWDDVLEIASSLQESVPDFHLMHEIDYLIGRVYASRGQFTKAREKYETVVRSASGGQTETAAMAQWMIGESYFHQKRYREAVRAYHRVETLFAYPQWQAAALLQSGKCHEQLGQWQDAISVYALILRKYSDTQYASPASDRMRVARTKTNITK